MARQKESVERIRLRERKNEKEERASERTIVRGRER